jgi:hypothetical protein
MAALPPGPRPEAGFGAFETNCRHSSGTGGCQSVRPGHRIAGWQIGSSSVAPCICTRLAGTTTSPPSGTRCSSAPREDDEARLADKRGGTGRSGAWAGASRDPASKKAARDASASSLVERRHEIALALVTTTGNEISRRPLRRPRTSRVTRRLGHRPADPTIESTRFSCRHTIWAAAPVHPSPYCTWTRHRLVHLLRSDLPRDVAVRVKTTRIALCPRSAVGSNMHGQPPSITAMARCRP